jgi:hypothetical protein
MKSMPKKVERLCYLLLRAKKAQREIRYPRLDDLERRREKELSSSSIVVNTFRLEDPWKRRHHALFTYVIFNFRLSLSDAG